MEGENMKLHGIATALVDQVQDLYTLETLLVEAMPAVIGRVQHADLEFALSDHLEETRKHVMRIRDIARKINTKPEMQAESVMASIIQRGMEKIMPLRDSDEISAAVIAMMHTVEQYEIACYSTAAAFAELLGESIIQNMLNLTLDEETLACETLTDIATFTDDEFELDKEAANLDH